MLTYALQLMHYFELFGPEGNQIVLNPFRQLYFIISISVDMSVLGSRGHTATDKLYIGTTCSSSGRRAR